MAYSSLNVMNRGRPCRLNSLLELFPTSFLKNNSTGSINQNNNNNNNNNNNHNSDNKTVIIAVMI